MERTSSAGRQRAWQQRLLDTYGPLLTDHQRDACRLYLDEDWSVTELAELLGCTRSGAHDLVRRGLAQLEHYELRLGHAVEFVRREALETELWAQLRSGSGAGPAAAGTPPLRSSEIASGRPPAASPPPTPAGG